MTTNSGYKLVFTTLINPFHKPFVNDFHLERDLVLHREAFIFTFTSFPHLSSNGPLDMVYELLLAIEKVIYQLITRTLAIQFKDIFAKHFNPH
jgi:hypothetical protein